MGEFRRVLDPARDDGVHVAEAVLLDRGAQRVVQVGVRLDAVDAVDFRHVVAGQLVAAAGPDFEDRAVGFVDEGGEVSFELAGGDHFVWRMESQDWEKGAFVARARFRMLV